MCILFLLEVRTAMRIVANYSIFIAVEQVNVLSLASIRNIMSSLPSYHLHTS